MTDDQFLMTKSIEHRAYMEEALKLAEKGRGSTNPNPMVGAVIVKNGEIVGRGYHSVYGGPHAETAAIKEAGPKAQGATLYVTLEPCCHYGHTPPCTNAIISAKIDHVAIGTIDPNPMVSGKGVEALRKVGISVATGILSKEITQQNEVYIKYISTKVPFILLKTAMSLDGKIATKTGDSKWISSEISRKVVHKLRKEYGAVMVGGRTVEIDNPELTARLVEASEDDQPVRIILDNKVQVSLDSQVVKTASKVPTLLVIPEERTNLFKDKLELLRQRKVGILLSPEIEGKIDLVSLLKELGKRGIDSIIIEGGSSLNSSALKSGIVDKFLFFVAPLIIGGGGAPSPIGGEGIEKVSQAQNLRITRIEKIGPDLMVEAYPIKNS